MKRSVCSFFGHRIIVPTDELKTKLKLLIEHLIVEMGVNTFLFGSRSNFYEVCHDVVSELKGKYSHIIRIVYTCKSEGCVLESESEKFKEFYSIIGRECEKILVMDKEVEFKNKYSAGKAGYIERNCAMIDDSNYCIFYYDQHYKLDFKKYSKRCLEYYRPRSGTATAFEYAKRKNKIIFNVKEELLW